MGEATEDDKVRLESAWKIHAYTNDYIRFADQKAGVFLAFQSGLLAAMFTVKLQTVCLDCPFGSWTAGCATVAFVGLALGAVFALLAVAPRLQAAFKTIERCWPWATTTPRMPPGLIYWEQVLGHKTGGDYSEAISSTNVRQLTNAVAEHTFVLGTIAHKKYMWVNLSVMVSSLPAVAGAVAIFLHRVP
jgi:hypothetical protein